MAKRRIDINEMKAQVRAYLDEENRKMVEKELGDEIENAIGKIFGPASQERAIPNIKDGLMPIYKRLCLTIIDNNYFSKTGIGSSSIVGYCLSVYHPHGDASIYGSMIRMIQDFCMPYPRLVGGIGNFGSQAGDSAASYRYTKAFGTNFLKDCIGEDLSKETVDYEKGENEYVSEPAYLSTRLPLALLYSNYGISHGFTTSTVSHNLNDIVDVCIKFIRDKNLGSGELSYGLFPDFATGGIIINKDEIKEIYTTGKGSVHLNAKIEIHHNEKTSNGKFENYLMITEIPYGIPYDDIYSDISKRVKMDNNIILSKISLPLVLTDENGNMIWRIDCPNNISLQDMRNIVSELYSKTRLSLKLSIRMNFMNERKIRTYSLRGILESWYDVRYDVMYRSLTARKNSLEVEKHIVEGLLVLCDRRDELIDFIRTKCKGKNDIINLLPEEFNISMKQAYYIAEQQIHYLTKMSQENVKIRYERVLKNIIEVEKDFSKVDSLIIESLLDLKRRYGVPRRTEIMEANSEDYSFDQFVITDGLVLSAYNGYGIFDNNTLLNVKNITNNLKNVRIDNKNYKGVIDIHDIDENTTHLLIIFNDGNCKRIKVSDISMINTWENIHVNNNIFIKKVIGLKHQDKLFIINDQGKMKIVDPTEISLNRIIKVGVIKFCFPINNDTFKHYDLLLMNDKSHYCCLNSIDDIPQISKSSSGVISKFKQDDNVYGCLISKNKDEPNVVVVSYTIDGDIGFTHSYSNDVFIRGSKNHSLKKLFSLNGNILSINQLELKKKSTVLLIGENNIMKSKMNQFGITSIPKKTGLKVLGFKTVDI